MNYDETEHVMRVVVIDDHPLLVHGVSQLFDLSVDFEMAGSATNAVEALELVSEVKPDLVLLDLNMGEESGVEILREIKKLGAPPKVVVLTVSNAAVDLRAVLQGGADGYLLKDMEPEDILDKLRETDTVDFVMTEQVSTMLARVIKDADGSVRREDVNLTAREEEILGLIVAGHRNKVIGRILNISDGTVKVHVKNLLRKLNARSRLEAAIWGIDNGYAQDKPGS